MENEFEPKVEKYTIIYDKDGRELARLNGNMDVNGKDWEQCMPIRIDYITVTTQLDNRKTMAKGGDE